MSRDRSNWCDEKYPNSSHAPLYARLGNTMNGNGMEWRCYCACALVEGKYAYDREKKNDAFFTHNTDLLKIK